MTMRHKGSLDITSNLAVSGTSTVHGASTVIGNLNAKGLLYPTSDGSANEIIETDGAGTLSFVALPIVVDDLNAQTGSVTITGVGTTSTTTAGGAITISGSLRVRESDSSPLVNQVTEIVVTTGTLTDLGGGVVQIDTGGSAGGGGDTVDQLQNTLYGQAFVA
jgi:hypothetical protein